MAQAKADRAADRIGHDRRARREQRLLAVGGVQRQTAPAAPRLQVRQRLGVLLQRDSRHAGQRLGGEVVAGRPESAVDDQHVGEAREPLQLRAQQREVISDRDLRGDLAIERRELLRDQRGVGIQRDPAHQLVARHQQ